MSIENWGGDRPDYKPDVFTTAYNSDQFKVSVTDTESTGSFSQQVMAWFFYNNGPNPIYFSVNSGVTTDNFKVPAKAYMWGDIPTNSIYFICDATKTATVYALGMW